MSEGIGVVVFLAIVGCAALLLKRIHRRRTAIRSAEAGAAPVAVPTFRVVTLGLQGSGKTLLLTSIYRRLQTPAGGRGYYLKAPFTQLIELNRWYQRVANSNEGWPDGTTRGEMREFEFDMLAQTGDGAEPVLKLGYLEYPGELLTEPDAPGLTTQAQLLESIGSADALIGIIDGLRVLQAYRGDVRGRVILQTTLDAMINCMLQARTPIAFVITKWDLLDELHPDENTRLGIVRNMLMDADGFRDLVRIQSARRVIRLIPVTAVGHDFAVLDHGEVRKKPDGRFEPANVELALSAVVPDIIRQIELSLDRSTREAVLAEARRQVRMGPREALLSLSSFVAARAGRVLMAAAGGGLVAEAGLTLFFDSQVDPEDRSDRLARLSAADRRAEEAVQARRRIVQELQHQVTVLEARLPQSRLYSENWT
jgi:hypothetical protein